MGKEQERLSVFFIFIVYRDLPGLVDTLHDVLNDPQKHTLYHHICQLLPEEIQSEFDQLASKAVAHGKLHFKFKLKYCFFFRHNIQWCSKRAAGQSLRYKNKFIFACFNRKAFLRTSSTNYTF